MGQSFIEGLGQQAAGGLTGGLISTGMGLLLQGQQDRRQIKQQQKLTDIQTNANMALAKFNYDQQMKMWDATNYGPQMEHLKKAGLNPALIYGTGGPGGTTAAAQAGPAGGGNAPGGGGEIMGMMMMKNQQDLIKAQTENLKADANLKNVDAQKRAGVDTTETLTRIDTLKQGIQNAKAQEALTNVETALKTIEQGYKDTREGYTNEILHQQLDNMAQEWVRVKYENDITKAAWQDRVKIIKQEAINTVIQGELMRSNININKKELDKMTNEINLLSEQYWGIGQGLEQKDKEIKIRDAEQKMQQKLIEFQIEYGAADRIINGVKAVGQTLGSAKMK